MLSSGSLNGPYMVLPAVSSKDGTFLGSSDSFSTRWQEAQLMPSTVTFPDMTCPMIRSVYCGKIVTAGAWQERHCCFLAALGRSEEHTSELQSLTNLVCRLLLEKQK